MMYEKVELGAGSSVRFVELDNSRIDGESILKTIHSYDKGGLWPSDFETVVFSFRSPISLLQSLKDEGVRDDYTFDNLIDLRSTCQVEEDRALISLPQFRRMDGLNEHNHELAHIPQRLGEVDGGMCNMTVVPVGNRSCSNFSFSTIYYSLNYVRFMCDDFVANSLFPGDKKSLVPSEKSLTDMLNRSIPEADDKLNFSDTVIACDICKIYPIDKEEGERIIEGLSVDIERKNKLKSYVNDLSCSLEKSFSGRDFPSKEEYCDGLMDLMRVVNVYEASRYCEHGDNFMVFIVPTLSFRKLDGSNYSINTQSYEEIESGFDIRLEQVADMVKERIDPKTKFYMNKRCY